MHIDVGSGFDPNTYFTTGLVDPAGFILGGGVVKGGNVKSVEKKDKPAAGSTPQTTDTRQTYASQMITKNYGIPVDKGDKSRVFFPYKNEDRLYNAYKTRNGWDIYKGRTKLDTSNGKNSNVLKAFIDYAEANLGQSKPTQYTDEQRKLIKEAGESFSRENGGPIKKGKTYLTGENGPELISTDTDGFVFDAERTRQIAGLFSNFFKGTGSSLQEHPYMKQVELERVKKQMNLPPGKGFTGQYDMFGRPTGYGANAGQTEQLIAMAREEEKITNRIQIIRVNNTVPIPMPAQEPSETSAAGTSDLFKNLRLMNIGQA